MASVAVRVTRDVPDAEQNLRKTYTSDEDNGNRTNMGDATGDHNRLTADGTYTYGYDNEGNITSRTNTSTRR